MPAMASKLVNIILYGDFPTISVPYTDNAEEACIKAAKRCKIGTLARHLFGLYRSSNKTWLCPCDVFKDQDNIDIDYEFRLRFKLANIGKLSRIDLAAFNYYFHQVRKDFLEGKIPETLKEKETALGLAVTDMRRVMLESGCTTKVVANEYKEYLPHEVKNQFRFLLSHFLRKAMADALAKLEENKQELPYIKEQYVQCIFDLKPNYGCEEYSAFIDEVGQSIPLRLQLDPFHNTQPGLRRQIGSKKAAWTHVCSVEELCFISMGKDTTVEISRRNGVPQYFRFQKQTEMRSFVSLLDGYYRLTEKWTFNLCKELPTPSINYLRRIKCHGPVGQTFAHNKLMNSSQKQKGIFMLRENSDYSSYSVDVLIDKNRSPVNVQIIKLNEKEYRLQDRDDVFESVQDLLTYYIGQNLFLTCIPPSEYDKSCLLLCKSENSDYTSTSSNTTSPLCIKINNFHMINVIAEGKFTFVRRAFWKKGNQNIKCCLKTLKPKHASQVNDFLKMIDKFIYCHDEAIMSMYGMIINPPTLVMEYISLGPLDIYLKNHHDELEEVDLVEAATYLAKALWYLEEQGIVHGNIRCSNVLVSNHEANSFRVKLCDIGMQDYNISQIHWIPPECYHNLQEAAKHSPADVWAFGTTLWEIFSYGDKPLDGSSYEQAKQLYMTGITLKKPINCNEDVFQLMTDCWIRDCDSRKKPQAIMRDINQTLYEAYNSRRKHEYAMVAAPQQKELDTISTSTASSSTTLNETLSDSPMSERRIENFVANFTLNTNGNGENGNLHIGQHGLPQSPSDISLLLLSQDQENSWMIEMDQLEKKEKLGQGFYGEVYKAIFKRYSGLKKEIVAVKQLKSGIGSCLLDLQREITIMKTLHHKNIVEIKGVVEEPELLLVMEYVPLSSLLVYLRTNKSRISEIELIKFATDIAEGMEYLGEKRIVHRDLAARNILVKDATTVKISDFGLAQVMGPKDYYRLQTNRDLPIRWYALETLRHWRFTHKSDVWSYGITLWEMFTFGEEPVLDGCQDDKLLEELESGKRLGCPPFASMNIYSYIMKRCWDADPEARPNFTELVTELQTMQGDLSL